MQLDSDLGITADDLNHRVQELRSRSWLESFLGMRYFLAPVESSALLPYGVNPEPVARGTFGGIEYAVYENELALSLANLYPDEVVSLSDFEDMSLGRAPAYLALERHPERGGHIRPGR